MLLTNAAVSKTHTCIYSNHKENSNNKPGMNVALKNFHFLFVHVFTGGIVGGGLQNLGLCSADTSFEKGVNLYRAHLL